MAGNTALNKAAQAKKDEFYTQLSDIEKELRHYRSFFEGKTVLCNCDDPYESNFFKYFAMNFNALKLKKLMATCYVSSPVSGTELQYYADAGGQLSFFPSENAIPAQDGKRPYRVEITEVNDENGDGRIDLSDVEYLLRNKKNTMTLLEGDGDFRSPECIELLKQADVVATNPPFSLFREYAAQLIEYRKSFLIIGSVNAVKYKEIFPLFMQNQLWLGYQNGDMAFTVPADYEPRATRYWQDEHGQKWRSMGNICWLTNIDIDKRHEELILYRHYNPEDYPKYVNYDAIEVAKTSDIPCDYDGLMGVPITFMDKYNPEQFEIIGMNWTVLADAELSDDIRQHHNVARRLNFYLPFPDGQGNAYSRMYDRIVIRNKHPQKAGLS